MKKTVILSVITVVIVSIVCIFEIQATKSNISANEESRGKLLMDMEGESDIAVDDIISDIQENGLEKDECREKIQEIADNILKNVDDIDFSDRKYINIMYNCNIIRKLAGLMSDKRQFESAEEKLRNQKLTAYSDKVFSYCLEVSDGQNEEADYKTLCREGKSIEKNLDELVKEYVDLLYGFYIDSAQTEDKQ